MRDSKLQIVTSAAVSFAALCIYLLNALRKSGNQVTSLELRLAKKTDECRDSKNQLDMKEKALVKANQIIQEKSDELKECKTTNSKITAELVTSRQIIASQNSQASLHKAAPRLLTVVTATDAEPRSQRSSSPPRRKLSINLFDSRNNASNNKEESTLTPVTANAKAS